MQLEIPQDDIGAVLPLNQALAPPTRDGAASIILDIDLFHQYDRSVADDEAWSFLEILRTKKNEVFEACITERAREVIH